MATTLGTLLLLIKGDTKDLKSKLTDADKSILAFAKNMSRMGNQLRNTGKQLTAELTLPLVGLAVAALKSAGQLEEFKAPLDEMRGSLRAAMADILRGALPALQGLAKRVSEAAKWFTGLSDGTKKTILVIAGLAAAIGPVLVIAGRMLTLFGFLQRAFVAARVAALSFNAAMLPNPIYLVVAALAALTIGANELAKKLDPAAKAMKEINDQATKLAETDREAGRRVLVMKIAEYTDKLSAANAELDRINEKVKKNPLGTDQSALQRAIANVDNIKRVLNELSKQVSEFDRETGKLTGGQKQLTEDQKTYQAALEKLRTEFGQVEQRAAIYGEELNVLAEKKRILKSVIDELVEKGFTAQGSAIQSILRLYGQLLASEQEVAEATEIHTEKLVEFAAKVDPLAKASAARAAAYKAEVDASLELDEATATLTDQLQTYGDIASSVFGGITDIVAISFQNQRIALENEEAARRAALESSITDESARAKALEDLDEEFEERRKKLAYDQAVRSRNASVFQSLLDTGNAVLSALATVKPTVPAGILASILVGALGLAKTTALAATPLPALAEGGSFIVPPGYPNDSFLTRVESGERVDVTPADQVRREASVLVERPLILAVDTTPVYRGLLRATRDGIALVAQRSVVP